MSPQSLQKDLFLINNVPNEQRPERLNKSPTHISKAAQHFRYLPTAQYPVTLATRASQSMIRLPHEAGPIGGWSQQVSGHSTGLDKDVLWPAFTLHTRLAHD